MKDEIPEEIKNDKEAILKEADKLLKDAGKRRLFGNILTLGGLSLATGVLIKNYGSIENILSAVSKFNDDAQLALFSQNDLAPTYSESEVLRPFRFNAFYPPSKAPVIDGGDFKLALSGKIANKTPWKLERLAALPQTEQITRHICVEGWSAIGRWGGVKFSTFLDAIEADKTCKYIGFKCADGYYESIDMKTALHPQTLLVLTHDGEVLPIKYGFPLKIRMPTKLGYKNAKHIVEIFATNIFPSGFWEERGYNWFGGS